MNCTSVDTNPIEQVLDIHRQFLRELSSHVSAHDYEQRPEVFETPLTFAATFSLSPAAPPPPSSTATATSSSSGNNNNNNTHQYQPMLTLLKKEPSAETASANAGDHQGDNILNDNDRIFPAAFRSGKHRHEFVVGRSTTMTPSDEKKSEGSDGKKTGSANRLFIDCGAGVEILFKRAILWTQPPTTEQQQQQPKTKGTRRTRQGEISNNDDSSSSSSLLLPPLLMHATQYERFIELEPTDPLYATGAMCLASLPNYPNNNNNNNNNNNSTSSSFFSSAQVPLMLRCGTNTHTLVDFTPTTSSSSLLLLFDQQQQQQQLKQPDKKQKKKAAAQQQEESILDVLKRVSSPSSSSSSSSDAIHFTVRFFATVKFFETECTNRVYIPYGLPDVMVVPHDGTFPPTRAYLHLTDQHHDGDDSSAENSTTTEQQDHQLVPEQNNNNHDRPRQQPPPPPLVAMSHYLLKAPFHDYRLRSLPCMLLVFPKEPDWETEMKKKQRQQQLRNNNNNSNAANAGEPTATRRNADDGDADRQIPTQLQTPTTRNRSSSEQPEEDDDDNGSSFDASSQTTSTDADEEERANQLGFATHHSLKHPVCFLNATQPNHKHLRDVSKKTLESSSILLSFTRNTAEMARRYTPASTSRPVMIRQFPHRNADIVGELKFGEVAVASSIRFDEKDKDWYVEWKYLGGFSRLRGTLGPFLIQLWEGRTTTVLDPPRFFTPSSSGSSSGGDDAAGGGGSSSNVRVRAMPSFINGRDTGCSVQPNEVRAAVALHAGPDNEHQSSVYVEWADGSGYSRKSARITSTGLQRQVNAEVQAFNATLHRLTQQVRVAAASRRAIRGAHHQSRFAGDGDGGGSDDDIPNDDELADIESRALEVLMSEGGASPPPRSSGGAGRHRARSSQQSDSEDGTARRQQQEEEANAAAGPTPPPSSSTAMGGGDPARTSPHQHSQQQQQRPPTRNTNANEQSSAVFDEMLRSLRRSGGGGGSSGRRQRLSLSQRLRQVQQQQQRSSNNNNNNSTMTPSSMLRDMSSTSALMTMMPPPPDDVDRVFLVELPQVRSAIAQAAKNMQQRQE